MFQIFRGQRRLANRTLGVIRRSSGAASMVSRKRPLEWWTNHYSKTEMWAMRRARMTWTPPRASRVPQALCYCSSPAVPPPQLSPEDCPRRRRAHTESSPPRPRFDRSPQLPIKLRNRGWNSIYCGVEREDVFDTGLAKFPMRVHPRALHLPLWDSDATSALPRWSVRSEFCGENCF